MMALKASADCRYCPTCPTRQDEEEGEEEEEKKNRREATGRGVHVHGRSITGLSSLAKYSAVQRGEECSKDYPGLGNRTILYPYSSAGITFTLDVIEDTGSNLTSDVSFIARAVPKDTYP